MGVGELSSMQSHHRMGPLLVPRLPQMLNLQMSLRALGRVGLPCDDYFELLMHWNMGRRLSSRLKGLPVSMRVRKRHKRKWKGEQTARRIILGPPICSIEFPAVVEVREMKTTKEDSYLYVTSDPPVYCRCNAPQLNMTNKVM